MLEIVNNINQDLLILKLAHQLIKKFKKLAYLLIISLANLLLISSTFAQAPEKMTYQAVVRNSTDQLVTNQGIGMQISILQASITGTAVYVETHNTTSNANGLVTIEIGNGTVVSGNFAAIDWANNVYFIKTEIDPTTAGGTNYTITGTSQLLSVAYALHAKSAQTITGEILETDPVFGTSLANSITATDTANWNNKIDTEIDGDITNELQVLTISNDTIFLTNGEFVKLPDENDPVFSASLAGSITVMDTANWNNHTIDTDTQIDSAGVAAFGFVAGPHTMDTNTQLSETEVDNYVANNGYLTTEVDGDANNEIQAFTVSSIGDTLHLSASNWVIIPGISIANATFPTVTTDTITSITDITATGGGEVTTNGGSAVSVRGVCWNATGNPTTADNITSDGTGTGVFLSNITSLSANTTYYVKAYATNSIGTAYGSEQIFTTNNGSSPTGMVQIPAGNYDINGTNVTLNSYSISPHEITNTQFIQFLNNISCNANGIYNDTVYGNVTYLSISSLSCAIDHNGTSFYFGGSTYAPTADCPVIEVTWHGANAFALWAGGRLPTEVEWEVVARGAAVAQVTSTYIDTYAGTNSSSQLGDYAWFDSNSINTHTVGTKLPNEIGLYDMSGNVWEWCSDWYQNTYPSGTNSPTGATSGSSRILRGGSWISSSGDCGLSIRGGYGPDGSSYDIGFRVVIP